MHHDARFVVAAALAVLGALSCRCAASPPRPDATRQPVPAASPGPGEPGSEGPPTAPPAPVYDAEFGGLFQLGSVTTVRKGETTDVVLAFASASGEGVPRHEVATTEAAFEVRLTDTRAPRFPFNRVLEVGDGWVERITFVYPEDDTQMSVRVATRGRAAPPVTLAAPPRLVITVSAP
jgi:hypothetical protein